jgi:hypothetical protein
MAFWLCVVLVLLPSAGSQPAPKSQVSAGEAFWAAKVAISDVQSFCERHREACNVGSQTAVALGQRAQVGAKMLYEFLSEQFGDESGAMSTTGSVPFPAARPSQDTLLAEDRVPAWRGPQPVRIGGAQ